MNGKKEQRRRETDREGTQWFFSRFGLQNNKKIRQGHGT